ncbi:MAG: branched-chain amino acid ABC transporter permease [Gemmataceae bacterium]
MTDFWQFVAIGLVTGSLYALIALGYTMVYGIIELINFAHGDLFMLGSFFALQTALWIGAAALPGATGFEAPGTGEAALAIAFLLVAAPVFCALVNVGIDRWIYKPVRHAPKLAAIVTAIGVSFVLMQIGVVWFGSVDLDFPNLVGSRDLLAGTGSPVRLSYKDFMVIGVTVPTMIALTVLVKFTTLGKAMRAAAQDPKAALLMGINVDRVIAATFAIGGALAGVASVVYGLYFNTVGYAMGFQNGVYAFTAAVLGGIGNIPGAVLGGILIGLIRSLGSAYVGEVWSEALIFVILIVILIFRPTGLLGSRTREKV